MPACFVGQECLTLQAVVASHSATARGWCRLLAQAAPSSRVGTDGSAFTKRIYGPLDEDDQDEENQEPVAENTEKGTTTACTAAATVSAPTAAQLTLLDDEVPLKRYLCKWRDVSHLHLSWETAAALKLVLGSQRATQALSTFTAKDGEDAFLNDFGLHLDLEYTDCDLEAGADVSSHHSIATDEVAAGAAGDEKGDDKKKQSTLPAGGRWFTNALYVTPERVLAADPPIASSSTSTTGKSAAAASEEAQAGQQQQEQLLLVKWCGLPYGCATWEHLREVPNGSLAFDAFKQRALSREEPTTSPGSSGGSGSGEGSSSEKRSRKGKKNKVSSVSLFLPAS